MGAVLTQHPGLFRAVVSRVGIYDALRSERWPNGEFNTTEFGTVTIREQFEALRAYSPYHHVTNGTPYPAVLLTTGLHDGRVPPGHSFKMAARLQAATASKHPVLLRVDFSSGHGIGSSRRARLGETADVYTFLFTQLGMTLPKK
jgi:prolyl oligopeptidase